MLLGLVLLIPPNPEKSLEAVSVYEGLRLERLAREAEEEESRKEEKSSRNLLREHTPSEVSHFLREHTPSFVLTKVCLRASPTKGTAAGSEEEGRLPRWPGGARCFTGHSPGRPGGASGGAAPPPSHSALGMATLNASLPKTGGPLCTACMPQVTSTATPRSSREQGVRRARATSPWASRRRGPLTRAT